MKTRKRSKPAKKQTKAKPNAKKKPHTANKQAKPKVYKHLNFLLEFCLYPIFSHDNLKK